MSFAPKPSLWPRVRANLFGSWGRLDAWFPAATLLDIQRNIEAGERDHGGEFLVVIEPRLSLLELIEGETARSRALEVFSAHRVWDTEANTGVLIYVLLAEHQVEIVADRGIAARCPRAFWDALCAELTAAFRTGTPRVGLLIVLDRLHAHCRELFPRDDAGHAEIGDRPIVL